MATLSPDLLCLSPVLPPSTAASVVRTASGGAVRPVRAHTGGCPQPQRSELRRRLSLVHHPPSPTLACLPLGGDLNKVPVRVGATPVPCDCGLCNLLILPWESWPRTRLGPRLLQSTGPFFRGKGLGGGTDAELHLCSGLFLVFLEKVTSRKGQAFRAFMKNSGTGPQGVPECHCSPRETSSHCVSCETLAHVLNIENN